MEEQKENVKEILIFAGTGEGRRLSEYLAAAGVKHTVCVATEYGEAVLKEHPLVTVHRGKMNEEKIADFLLKGKFTAVVDATHPYAKEVTQNIKEALQETGKAIPYLRLKRETFWQKGQGMRKEERTAISDTQHIFYFETQEACAKALENTEGNILLTTGSKELAKYCISEEVKSRLYVRVIPGVESISLCMEQGIGVSRIIAMQGPFTTQMNEAVIRQFRISHLVTKQSGASGGYPEKLEAADKEGVPVYVIGCPEEEDGFSFFGICAELEKVCGKKILEKFRMEIVLAGVGMGTENGMTKEVRDAVDEADILLGAERLLNFSTIREKHPFYQAKQIIPYLQNVQERNFDGKPPKVVIMFSGDSGFYSGCRTLYTALEQEIHEERLRACIRILPGISSVAYLAARIGESYHDAALYSMHGQELYNLARKVAGSPKTFLLTSGVKDVRRLGEILMQSDMAACEIVTGYQLSYKEEQIRTYTPSECRTLEREGLYTCLVKNPFAVKRRLTHGIPDEEFIREKIPMTKEAVREVSICRLRLREGAVVYDIGSGTGSVAVEIASLSDDVQVYAVEHNKEAVSLITRNKEKFGLQNITVVETSAPEGLASLPVATHAFIGGSSGRLREILAKLREINPKIRIVINAVSLETICEIKDIAASLCIEEVEIVQLQATGMKKAGEHHLMQAQNPVWILAFTFC